MYTQFIMFEGLLHITRLLWWCTCETHVSESRFIAVRAINSKTLSDVLNFSLGLVANLC